MTFVRSQLILQASLVLARVATVAIRYSAIRRQFFDRDVQRELQAKEIAVLDYPTVQMRVMPLLATAFALHYTGQAMWKIYWGTRSKVESGDLSELASLHSMSSGLKSLCTTYATDGIEIGRRSLGGHGFGAGSGLIALNNDYHSRVTVEGDNYMITQQVANYVIKQISQILKSEIHTTGANYVESLLRRHRPGSSRNTSVASIPEMLANTELLCSVFEQRAAFYAYKAHEARVVQRRPWNSLLIQFHQLSNALSQCIIIQNFYNAVKEDVDLSPASRTVLWDLFRLFACKTIEDNVKEFVSAQLFAQGSDLDDLTTVSQEVMLRIRPHAVKLVDAWQVPDFLLDSALGRRDGKVYEDLFDRAHRKNPLNKLTFNPNFWEDELIKGREDGMKEAEKLAKL